MMLLVRDVRNSSSIAQAWDLSQFTELLQSVRKRLCASPISRAPFLSAVSSTSDEAADAAVLKYFKKGFPTHWTLRGMEGHGLSYSSGRRDVGLSGQLVDAWALSQSLVDSPRATELRLYLEFLLTTAILHSLYHALQADHREGDDDELSAVLELTDGILENEQAKTSQCKGGLVWGGPVGATWRRSALSEAQAEDFSVIEGVFVELARPSDGRLVEIRLDVELLESTLRAPEFAPFDAAKLVTAEGNARRTSTVAVRRRQICQKVLLEPVVSPWDEVERHEGQPSPPPTPFSAHHDDDEDDGEGEDKEFVITN